MATLQDELDWEAKMVDSGVDKYHAAMDAARFKPAKGGGLKPQNDESATTYGVSMIREHFEDFEVAIDMFIEEAFTSRGKRDIAASYLARMDVRTTAFIAAKCIIDTISVDRKQTDLVFTISQKIEDQMRLTRFHEDYSKYWDAIVEDMRLRGVKNYRHKRKVLTHCHNKALDNDPRPEAEKRRWIAWPKADRVRLGLTLVELFKASTNLITRNNVRLGNKTSYTIEGTDYAVNLIEANMELFQYLHPEFLPTLIRPREWSTPYNGGFHAPELRRRRPLCKVRGYARKAHGAALKAAEMPAVYTAINAAQNVAWRVNEFVLEQAGLELAARGIGCPVGMNQPAPENPLPYPEQGNLNDVQYEALKQGIRNSLTPDESALLQEHSRLMRDWHSRRLSNRGKMLGVANTYKIAKLMTHKERFFYVHSFDSRGRLYPVGVHLTPQGTGLAKGLLEFADSVALGRWGYWHLALHAAGVYGIDKVSLDDRLAWVHDNSEAIMAVWADPAGSRDFWGAADKPYVFLGACKELAEIWMQHGSQVLTIVNKAKESVEWFASDYQSRMPCAQDGSCNGTQHFSAMLLDVTGATATNMNKSTAQSKPNDIYGETAQAAVRFIKQDLKDGMLFVGKEHKTMLDDERQILEVWLRRLKVDRKVCKRSTMIIPYGGQKTSCFNDVRDVLNEKLETLARQGKPISWDSRTVYSAAFILHHYVWKALDEVVVAARRAMKFLSKIATVQVRTNQPMQWTTPIGYPCFQDYKDFKPVSVKTQICGRMDIKYLEPGDDLDKCKMRNAFPPNFVHSMDATHLMMSVGAALDVGIDQFALVHDSYAVPAGQVEGFHGVIRQEFVNLYHFNRLLGLLNEQRERNPERAGEYPGMDMVEPGDFDLNDVIDAPYFFG